MPIDLRFVCGMLATWRLTHLLSAEDGPAEMVVHIRARLGDSVAGRAMDCFHCLSIWIAAPIALFVATSPIMWFVTWLALSGGACLLDRVTIRVTEYLAPNRAVREGEGHVLLWTATPGDQGDDRASRAADARIAGSIGIDPPWLPW
ncbi:MAG: DUF1360 domain-containing protein [Gemmatimonadaceae bacterium]